MGEHSSLWRRMVADYVSWSPWIAATLGATVVGFFAARLSDSAKTFLSDTATIGWVTAFATFGAAMVALRIASDTNRRIEARQTLESGLYMATLVGIAGQIQVALIMLDHKASKTEGGIKTLLVDLQDLKNLLNSIDITKVHGYSPEAAAHLGRNLQFMSLLAASPGSWSQTTELLKSDMPKFKSSAAEFLDKAKAARNQYFDPYIKT